MYCWMSNLVLIEPSVILKCCDCLRNHVCFLCYCAQDRFDFYLLSQCPIQFRLFPRVFIFNEVVVIIVHLLSCVQLFATLCTAAHQASLSFTVSQNLLNLCPLNQWCNLTISSSATPFFFCPQSFPASVSRLFISGGQITAASASVLPVNEYSGVISFRIDWFDLLSVQGELHQNKSE